MDDLERTLPAAEGALEAEQSSGKSPQNEFCLNCGTRLVDKFCHHCGQKNIPSRQTLGELWMNFVSSFWSYEGKFFLTTRYLITKPGFLAKEYNAGRRESYFHPARMYVFISFVFFLLFISLPDKDAITETGPLTDQEKNAMKEKIMKETKNVDSVLKAIPGNDTSLQKIFSSPIMDSVKSEVKRKKAGKKSNFYLEKSEYKSVKTYDSIQQQLPEKDRDGWIKHKLVSRSIELNQKYKDDSGQFGKDFGTAFSENFSKILFYLLPFFALILKILYLRKDYFYSEHLVFSIYYYNFFFFAGSLRLLVNLVPWLTWLGTVISFWIFFYLVFAMKRTYNQSWGKTILKFLILDFIFMFFAILAMVITAFFILMMI